MKFAASIIAMMAAQANAVSIETETEGDHSAMDTIMDKLHEIKDPASYDTFHEWFAGQEAHDLWSHMSRRQASRVQYMVYFKNLKFVYPQDEESYEKIMNEINESKTMGRKHKRKALRWVGKFSHRAEKFKGIVHDFEALIDSSMATCQETDSQKVCKGAIWEIRKFTKQMNKKVVSKTQRKKMFEIAQGWKKNFWQWRKKTSTLRRAIFKTKTFDELDAVKKLISSAFEHEHILGFHVAKLQSFIERRTPKIHERMARLTSKANYKSFNIMITETRGSNKMEKLLTDITGSEELIQKHRARLIARCTKWVGIWERREERRLKRNYTKKIHKVVPADFNKEKGIARLEKLRGWIKNKFTKGKLSQMNFDWLISQLEMQMFHFKPMTFEAFKTMIGELTSTKAAKNLYAQISECTEVTPEQKVSLFAYYEEYYPEVVEIERIRIQRETKVTELTTEIAKFTGPGDGRWILQKLKEYTYLETTDIYKIKKIIKKKEIAIQIQIDADNAPKRRAFIDAYEGLIATVQNFDQVRKWKKEIKKSICTPEEKDTLASKLQAAFEAVQKAKADKHAFMEEMKLLIWSTKTGEGFTAIRGQVDGSDKIGDNQKRILHVLINDRELFFESKFRNDSIEFQTHAADVATHGSTDGHDHSGDEFMSGDEDDLTPEEIIECKSYLCEKMNTLIDTLSNVETIMESDNTEAKAVASIFLDPKKEE